MDCSWNCYVLVIRVVEAIRVQLRGRATKVEPGIYFYIGSSRKPCTVLSRIARHISKTKQVHWHIDQLTTSEKAGVVGAIMVSSKITDCELELSKTVELAGLAYVPGFGSTDKPMSTSHLFKCNVDDIVECARLIYELTEKTPGVTELVYVEVPCRESPKARNPCTP